MGQAKLRGRREDRVAEAKSKLAAYRPEKLVCNNCKTEFADFYEMDTQGMSGITSAFAGICPSCQQSTYAVRGDPEAVTEAVTKLAMIMEEDMAPAEIGFQKI